MRQQDAQQDAEGRIYGQHSPGFRPSHDICLFLMRLVEGAGCGLLLPLNSTDCQHVTAMSLKADLSNCGVSCLHSPISTQGPDPRTFDHLAATFPHLCSSTEP
jgi:hypothetical protein